MRKSFQFSIPIFVFILILEHREIGLIAGGSYFVTIESGKNSTSRLMGVSAITESAVAPHLKDFPEIVADLLWLEVESTETADSRGIDDAAALWQVIHFGESCCVLTLIVSQAEFSRLGSGGGDEAVEKGGFAHSAVAAEERCPVTKFRHEAFKTFARRGRDSHTGIAELAIERHDRIEVPALVGIVQIHLIKNKEDGHPVCFGRGEEAIDEGGVGLRVSDGDHEPGEVYVSGNDVALLREVRSATDDVVAAVMDFGNKRTALGSPLSGRGYFDPVANGHRVGTTNTAKAKVPFHLTRKELAVVCANVVPTSCIPNNKTFHLSPITRS